MWCTDPDLGPRVVCLDSWRCTLDVALRDY